MKKYVWILVVIIIAVIISLTYPFNETKTIQIGVSEALTGNYADIGNDITRGIRKAFSEIDSQKMFGDKVELVISDNAADPKLAVGDYQLYKSQNIKIVMSAFSGVINALNPLSKQDGVILMHMAATDQFAKENEYAFKLYSDTTKEASLISKYIWLNKLEGQLGIVYVENPTTVLLINHFKNELAGFKKYSFNPKDTDFRTIITKMKADNIKNVILLGYSTQDLAFIKQSAELKFQPKYVFTTSDGSVKDIIDNVESFISSSTKYLTTAYGVNDLNYLFGYDIAKTLIKGMESCHNLGQKADDPECLKIELKKVSFEGKSGQINITEDRVAEVFPTLMTIENKKLVPFE